MNKNNMPNVAQLMLNRQNAMEYPIVVSCDAHSESTYIFEQMLLSCLNDNFPKNMILSFQKIPEPVR
jgi:hypothetical protein